jgi:hypothetical protein
MRQNVVGWFPKTKKIPVFTEFLSDTKSACRDMGQILIDREKFADSEYIKNSFWPLVSLGNFFLSTVDMYNYTCIKKKTCAVSGRK